MSTGWEREYLKNKKIYDAIFSDVMCQKKQDLNSFVWFENEIRNIIPQRKHIVPTASGTDALVIALRALDIGPGDEVLVTAFSWISSASAVLLVGATPVFCEICPKTYHMDFNSIKKMTTEKTKAIIFPYLFGNMSVVSQITEFCDSLGIHFIEDACQSIGSKVFGEPAGSHGIISTLSFNSNKNISGVTGGGALLTNDEKVESRARKMIQHGENEMLGYNSKMYLLNAEIIIYRLSFLEIWQACRQRLAKRLDSFFLSLGYCIQSMPIVEHNYHKYVVQFPDNRTREKWRKELKAPVHYDTCLNHLPMFRNCRSDATPIAEHLSNTILTIPMNHMTTSEEIDTLIEKMENV